MVDAKSLTHRELVSEVKYGYWFNLACERLYARLDFLLNLIQLLGGSAAVVALFQGDQKLTALSGVLLASCAALALLLQPSIKSERHRATKCQFLELDSKCWSMDAIGLSAEIASIRKEAPSGVRLLGDPSYNATLKAMGMERYAVKLSIGARFLDLIS